MNSDFFDRFDKRQIRLMSLAVILITAAVLFSYVILPKVKIYRSSVVTRDALVTTTNNADLIAAQLKMMQKEVNQLHRELHGDMDQMPAKQVESYVIGQLQDISWRNNVELTSLEPQPGKLVNNFSETLFKVELTGNYFDLYAWLIDASSDLGFVVVKKYDIKPIGQLDKDPQLNAKLTMATYRSEQR